MALGWLIIWTRHQWYRHLFMSLTFHFICSWLANLGVGTVHMKCLACRNTSLWLLLFPPLIYHAPYYWILNWSIIQFNVYHASELLLLPFQHSKNGSVTALIWGALPQPRSDRRKDRVETNPEQLTAASVQAEISFLFYAQVLKSPWVPYLTLYFL